MIAIEVKENVQALKDRVDALKVEIDAIQAVTDLWVVNSDDLSLPVDTEVQAQEALYNALNVSVSKAATSLTDALEAVRAVSA